MEKGEIEECIYIYYQTDQVREKVFEEDYMSILWRGRIELAETTQGVAPDIEENFTPNIEIY